jgi:hypothetical protein
VSTVGAPARHSGRWSACFYVPKGTGVVGLYSDGGGRLLDAEDAVVFSFEGGKATYYSFPVPAGHEGRLWRLVHCSGTKRLMTVPPCLARSPDELLLPREVVEADAVR